MNANNKTCCMCSVVSPVQLALQYCTYVRGVNRRAIHPDKNRAPHSIFAQKAAAPAVALPVPERVVRAPSESDRTCRALPAAGQALPLCQRAQNHPATVRRRLAVELLYLEFSFGLRQ